MELIGQQGLRLEQIPGNRTSHYRTEVLGFLPEIEGLYRNRDTQYLSCHFKPNPH